MRLQVSHCTHALTHIYTHIPTDPHRHTYRHTDRHTDTQTTRYFPTRRIPIHSVNEMTECKNCAYMSYLIHIQAYFVLFLVYICCGAKGYFLCRQIKLWNAFTLPKLGQNVGMCCYICLSVYLSVFLSVSLSGWLASQLYVCLSACVSVCLPACVSM